MPEICSAQAHTWSPSVLTNRGYQVCEKEDEDMSTAKTNIDVERAVSLWGDTVMRLAFCKMTNRIDAEEVTQRVFLKLCQRRFPFKNDEHLKAWLLRVTLTCSVDVKRELWAERSVMFTEIDETIAEIVQARDTIPFCDAEPVLTTSFVAGAVASLPERQRIAIHLYYFEDYSVKEIALIMEEKSSTVRSHLHRARKALKGMIGGSYE